MGMIVHRRQRRYRVWSTVCDQYATPSMTREEMAAELARPIHGHQSERTPEAIEARLRRADDNGTSAHGRKRSAARWDTEMCNGCGSFHHKHREGCCDDPRGHPCHGPRCKPQGGE